MADPLIHCPKPAMQGPLVTAVIPTRNRPELVKRAVTSALEQTYSQLEIIVVIDGPDSETAHALASFDPARLRILCLPESVGGGEARNVGVRWARGEWIAFLDDDDEWKPRRIEKQISAGLASSRRWPLLCSQVLARTPEADTPGPKRPPRSPIQSICWFAPASPMVRASCRHPLSWRNANS